MLSYPFLTPACFQTTSQLQFMASCVSLLISEAFQPCKVLICQRSMINSLKKNENGQEKDNAAVFSINHLGKQKQKSAIEHVKISTLMVTA
jgi:hypothetical protein